MVTAKLPTEVAKPVECLRAPGSSVGSGDASLPALGKPLFAALVPYGAHLAISVYEDRKDSWWRDTVEGRRQELEALVKSTLESLSLPAAIDALDRNAPGSQQQDLPPALVEQMERFREQGGLTALYRLKGDVDKMSQLNTSTLLQAQTALEAESKEDASVRETFSGSKHWTRQESRIAGQGYWKRLEELKGTIKMARDSDAVVQSKMTKWSQSWQILEAGESVVRAQLPSDAGTASPSAAISSSSTVVRELRSTLERIDDALAELAALATETRSLVRSDDIRDKVMREVVRLSSNAAGDQGIGGQGGYAGEVDLSPEMFEGLFDGEFRKYKGVESQLDGFEKRVEGLLQRAGVSTIMRGVTIDQRRPDHGHSRSSHATRRKTRPSPRNSSRIPPPSPSATRSSPISPSPLPSSSRCTLTSPRVSSSTMDLRH
jgi:programmed cell death 6-interacting protein